MSSRPRTWASLVLPGLTFGMVALFTCVQGCSTPLNSEAYLRLSVASPGGALAHAKGPFVSRYFRAGTENLFVQLDTEEALGIPRVQAITREIQDASRGFATGYAARQEGYDPRTELPNHGLSWKTPEVPNEVGFPDAWRGAFLAGWQLAEEEKTRGLHLP